MMILVLNEVEDPRKPSCNFRHSLVTIIFISLIRDQHKRERDGRVRDRIKAACFPTKGGRLNKWPKFY